MIKRLAVSLITGLSVLMFSGVSKAGSKVDNVLDKLITYQASGTHVFKSPTYMGVSLGKFRFRLKNDLLNLPIYTIRPPRATLSCSGLDFDAGLISALNLDVFQRMLEQAGASLSWGVMIGLIYSLPGVADAFQKLNEWGRWGQALGGNVCSLGKSLGTTLGGKVFHREQTKSQENSLKDNIVSTFEEAIKNYKNNLKAQNLYYTFPYTYLYKSGFASSDKDIANLIASFFGVISFYPADPSSTANPPICTKKECMEEENMRFIVRSPKLETIEEILYPEDTAIKVWDCDWQTLNTDAGKVETCKSIKETTVTIKRGLAGLIYDKLSKIVDKLYTGQKLDNADAAFVYYFGLSDIVNGLVLLKRKYNGNTAGTYDAYLDTVSQYIAIQVLKGLVKTAKENVMKASGSQAADKLPYDSFKAILDNVNKAESQLTERLNEIQNGVEALRGLRTVFLDIKSETDEELRRKFGSFLMGQRVD